MTRHRVYRGTCAICRVDLYRDPLLHYTSQGHQDRAAAFDRQQARNERRAIRAIDAATEREA